MAVVNGSDDKMRDLIAQAAEGLTGDGNDDLDAGAEGDADAGADAGADDGVVDDASGAEGTDGATGDGDDAGADEGGDGADAGTAGDVEGADAAAAAEAAAKGAEGAADAGKAGAKDGKKAEEQDAFAKEHGLKSKDKLGRENRIPHHIVRDRIVPNAIKKEKAVWTAQELAPRDAKIRTYEDRLGKIGETENIMFGQPRRYLAMLASIPGYQEIFSEMRGGKAGIETKEDVGTKLATDANDPEPQPDAKDASGNPIGYTQKGLANLRAWDRRQAAREASAAAIAEFNKQIKPMRDRFDSVTASEKVGQDVDNIISIASQWPGFQENHAAILDIVQKGTEPLNTPTKMYQAVQRAYNEVMFGALGKKKETEEEARARYFKEFEQNLRRAPRSTAARATVSRNEPKTGDDENVSSDDRMRNIIADSIRKSGLAKA